MRNEKRISILETGSSEAHLRKLLQSMNQNLCPLNPDREVDVKLLPK